MHDVVALLEEVRAKDFNSGRPLLLHRGQIGTVVMIYANSACEVEFADHDGRAYAILPIGPEKPDGPSRLSRLRRRVSARCILIAVNCGRMPSVPS